MLVCWFGVVCLSVCLFVCSFVCFECFSTADLEGIATSYELSKLKFEIGFEQFRTLAGFSKMLFRMKLT